jgi:hypothetical protein
MARIFGGWDSDTERAGCVPLSPWNVPTSPNLDVRYDNFKTFRKQKEKD